MEYLIKSAVAATDIAPSSGLSGDLAPAWDKSPEATLPGAFQQGEAAFASSGIAPAPSSPHRGEVGSRGAPGEGAVPAVIVVAETEGDVDAREALLDLSMGPKRKTKSSEKLRRGRRPSEGLAFVARDGAGAVVGTVRLWDVKLGEGGAAALLLGPLAVDPSIKNSGIGSALIREGLQRLAAAGAKGCVVMGDPAFYKKFGFRNEDDIVFPGCAPQYFLALALSGQMACGNVRYHEAFYG